MRSVQCIHAAPRKTAEALEAQGNIWLLLSSHILAYGQIIELFMPFFG